jgi:hypothetical protein
MEMHFPDLRRLLELWAAWYSIGVDGWLFTDESTHTCSLEFANPTDERGISPARPPYPLDPALDSLLLLALNDFGLQCNRLGSITLSRTSTAEEIALAAEPIIALMEAEQRFFSGRRLSVFSELRREYGDFGSHTLTLDLTIQDGRIVIRHPSFEMNNRRRGFKLDLWETMTSALMTYEEIFEQGVALGHSLTGTPESEDDLHQDGEEAGPGDAEAADKPQGLPFPCQSQSEASHLARLSNQVAPTRQAAADGTILTSTHSLRELAALITFVRFCEPLGAMQRV